MSHPVPAPRRVGNADIIHHDGFDPTIVSPYVPAIRTIQNARLVFISGVTGAPAYHDHPHRSEDFDTIPADIAGQFERALHHLDLALKAAGCRREDVVNLNRFFTNVAEDQDTVNRMQSEWFGDHIPASTSVEVVRLATDPRLRLEIAAIAAAPQDGAEPAP